MRRSALIEERVREYPRAKDFFRDIPVMPGSQEILRLLLSSYARVHHNSCYGIPNVICREV